MTSFYLISETEAIDYKLDQSLEKILKAFKNFKSEIKILKQKIKKLEDNKKKYNIKKKLKGKYNKKKSKKFSKKELVKLYQVKILINEIC